MAELDTAVAKATKLRHQERAIADAAALTKKIAKLDDIAVIKGDIKAATKVREIEKADSDATHADFFESGDALERAVAVLKKQAHDCKQASLVQLKTLKLIPDDAKKAINAFSRTPMIVWL